MSKTLGRTPVETPSTPQDAAAGPERSPRRVIDPDGTVWTEVLEGETTRSPRRAPGPTPGGTFRPVADGQHTPGCARYHGTLVPCDEPRSPRAAGAPADQIELARGKVPQAEIDATAETPIDPADVHSDDAMLSAVQAQEDVLTPVAEEIRAVLNRYSAEAPSGTPDYILANYLIDCLKAFNEAVSLRSVWRGEPIEQMILHTDKDR